MSISFLMRDCKDPSFARFFRDGRCCNTIEGIGFFCTFSFRSPTHYISIIKHHYTTLNMGCVQVSIRKLSVATVSAIREIGRPDVALGTEKISIFGHQKRNKSAVRRCLYDIEICLSAVHIDII